MLLFLVSHEWLVLGELEIVLEYLKINAVARTYRAGIQHTQSVTSRRYLYIVIGSTNYIISDDGPYKYCLIYSVALLMVFF